MFGKKFKGSNFRIYGSSAFSFFQLILGKANKYIYCDGAKIWIVSLIKIKIQGL